MGPFHQATQLLSSLTYFTPPTARITVKNFLFLSAACFKKSPGPLFARNCNQSQIMSKRIAIIGAGASGLPCIKEALESGFIPICFEKTSYTGGLWRYHDDDEEGVASVMKSTIINSSKEMSAFSDFPPPKELPNYCHNSLLVSRI